MGRFSVHVADEQETELGDIIPSIDSTEPSKSETKLDLPTATAEINEHPVTLRAPKSALIDKSISKEDPKGVRFTVEEKKETETDG